MPEKQGGQAERKANSPGETRAENRFPEGKEPFRGPDVFHKPPDR